MKFRWKATVEEMTGKFHSELKQLHENNIKLKMENKMLQSNIQSLNETNNSSFKIIRSDNYPS